MLTLTSSRFATVEELFRFKEHAFKLKKFPGYIKDQWGIKAHNRPWVERAGDFKKNQLIIEVGGGYSTLPEYLSKKYKLKAWVGDDFGIKTGDKIWSRWGNPKNYARKNRLVKYVFEPFGTFSKEYPSKYFDRIFSVSTLEHIDSCKIIDVFKDMNRCIKRGGMQVHSIDLKTVSYRQCLVNWLFDRIPKVGTYYPWLISEVKYWEETLKKSGIKIAVKSPSPFELLDRSVLVEPPDIVYKFYPPTNKSKPYGPTASLLLIIKDL